MPVIIFAIMLTFFKNVPLYSESTNIYGEQANMRGEQVGASDKAGNPPLVLTIDDAVKLAQENNTTIKIDTLTLRELGTKKNTSWNSVFPTLEISGGYSNDFENTTEKLTISGGISVKLSANLATSIIGARLNYKKGLITFEESQRSIERDVRKSFIGLLYQKDYCGLQEKFLETSKNQYDTNRAKYAKGQISDLDVATARLNYEKQKPVLLQAQVDYANSIALFLQVLGVDQTTAIDITGTIEDALSMTEISFDTLPVPKEPAPSVQQAMLDVAIAKNNLATSRASAYSPVITASYTYGKSWVLDPEMDSITNQLQLSARIPLDGYFPWSVGGVGVKSSKYALQKQELTLEDTRTTVAVKTDNYIRTINQALAQGRVAQENATLAQQNYDLTKTAYNYGKTDLMALQKASDDVLDAQVKVKNAAYTLIASILDMEYLLGIEYNSLAPNESTKEGE